MSVVRFRSKVRVADALGVARLGLTSRPTRSALSALGIAIGIGAIVGVLGISASSKSDLLAELDRLGNLLTITAQQGTTAGSRLGVRAPTLTISPYTYIV
jgi:ABC-type antimicrobial peptide transport system permease subunit